MMRWKGFSAPLRSQLKLFRHSFVNYSFLAPLVLSKLRGFLGVICEGPKHPPFAGCNEKSGSADRNFKVVTILLGSTPQRKIGCNSLVNFPSNMDCKCLVVVPALHLRTLLSSCSFSSTYGFYFKLGLNKANI